MMTLIQDLNRFGNNHLYIKREDLIPFSFGGNKARKAQLFFREIDARKHDAVVTYGSGSSNHCRVIANMAAQRGILCSIISPEEASDETFNTAMMRLFGAEITVCPVDRVAMTIEAKLAQLREQGLNPYFIPGGGHGNIGTQAFVDCYAEIADYEEAQKVHFDYIFLASGTGTTQAGLICGQLMRNDERQIIGISIARRNPRGREVVLDSVKEYLQAQNFVCSEAEIQEKTVFLDDYVLGGYGNYDTDVEITVRNMMVKHGVPMNTTYTGKAFSGMQKYLLANDIRGKNILFLHTGGAPLYFDWLRSIEA